jgi:hypothetical protein
MAGLETTPDMYDLRMSEGVRPLYDAVKKFIYTEVEPITAEFFRLGQGRADHWGTARASSNCSSRSRTRPRSRVCGTSSCPTPRPVRD